MKIDKKIFSWAMYDWANSAYATTVLVALFPIMFKQFWCSGLDSTESTALLAVMNSVSCIIVAIIAPILGAIADRSGGRKLFLALFTLLGAVTTALMAGIGKGDYQFARLLFMLATIGFSGGLTFYDSLLLNVADDKKIDFVSGLGYSMGYIGGALLFSVNTWMMTSPQTFGLTDSTAAARWSFISVGIWWIVFSIPLFLYVPEDKGDKVSISRAISEGLAQLANTFKQLKQYRQVMLFLCAYWFYIDGVDTIIRMAADYGLSIGLATDDLIKAILLTNFIGFPAALIYGYLGQKAGPRAGIYFGITAYVAITFFAAFMDSRLEFYILAGTVGLVQGGLQAMSRSFYARLIPADKQAEFFGIYNMLGKFAVFLGPLLVGYGAVFARHMGAAQETASRYGIFSVMILFAIGALCFAFVKPGNIEKA